MSSLIDKTVIINAIKEHYNLKKDSDFAVFLGIAPTTLSSWYARSTLNWDLIFAKCVDVDFDLLIKEGVAKTKNDNISKLENKSNDNRLELEMIKELSAENALLKLKIEDLKKAKNKIKQSSRYGNLAAEP